MTGACLSSNEERVVLYDMSQKLIGISSGHEDGIITVDVMIIITVLVLILLTQVTVPDL